MSLYSLVIGITGSALEVVLIWRAWKCALFSRFPLFYSYIAYVLLGSTTSLLIYRLRASYYPTFFWEFFLISLLVEFGVLIEISDHMFDLYPAIRRLGRFLAGCVCGVFSFYIVLAFTHPLSRRAATLDLFKRVSITKAAIIIVLLAMARYYRLPVGKNVAGLMLGFSAYLGINIVNFALEERFAPGVYDSVFAVVGPLSSIVCLLIWTAKLWRYEPVLTEAGQLAGASHEVSEPVIYKIDRLNQTLMKVLRR
jgi:phage shock protein PspC (stress-responsive transcriptional regulator)